MNPAVTQTTGQILLSDGLPSDFQMAACLRAWLRCCSAGVNMSTLCYDVFSSLQEPPTPKEETNTGPCDGKYVNENSIICVCILITISITTRVVMITSY